MVSIKAGVRHTVHDNYNSAFFNLRAAEKQNLVYLKNYLHVTLFYFYFSGFWKEKDN